MTDQLVQCDDQQLAELIAADETTSFHAAWLHHVDQCERCQNRLRELAADDADWKKAAQSLRRTAIDRTTYRKDKATTWNESMVTSLLSPPSHPEMLGRLGRYEIERLIGSGGMGIVFKAYDTELNRPVAVKILAPYLSSSPSATKRFAREARAAAGIVDDHVVPIFNVESDGEPPFLVMQYVAGGSLQERLDRDGYLEVAEVLRIGLQTAKGLAAAHAQGLIHRDVKPSNILLDEGVERALLSDFGLAHAEHEVSLTHSGFHPGTPHYMSPEQVRGETIDSRSDLFSLGCVLYALCTGRPAFQADTSYAVLRKITDSEPQSLFQINPAIPNWLESIVMRLLAKSPSDRYSSAREVSQLLENCLAHVHQPNEVPLPDSLRPRQHFRSKRGLLAGALLIATLAILVGLVSPLGNSPNDTGINHFAQNEANRQTNGAVVQAALNEDRKAKSKQKATGDAARKELVQLAEAFDRQVTFVSATMPSEKQQDGNEDETTQRQIKVNQDDIAIHAEALLLFEESHRGSHIGLMALRKLLAPSGLMFIENDPLSPRARAVQRLVHYADRPILSEVLFHAVRFNPDPETATTLRSIVDAPKVSRYVKPSAQLNLAKWILSFEWTTASSPDSITRPTNGVVDSDLSPTAKQLSTLTWKKYLAAAPDAETYAKWRTEAISLLEGLRDTATDIHPPGVNSAGNGIFRISHEITKKNPTLADLANQQLQEIANGKPSVDSIDSDIREAADRYEFICLIEDFDRWFQSSLSRLPATIPSEALPAQTVNLSQETVDGMLGKIDLAKKLEGLLLFERSRRGEHLGLMALHHVIAHCRRHASPPTDVRSANAEALARLKHYGSQPMLGPTLLAIAGGHRSISGSVDRRTEPALRAVLASSDLSTSMKPVAQLALCNWLLQFESFVANRDKLVQSVEQTPHNVQEAAKALATKSLLAELPTEEKFRVWKGEAMALLEVLSTTASDVHIPAVKMDQHPSVLRIDPIETEKNNTVAQVASRTLKSLKESSEQK